MEEPPITSSSSNLGLQVLNWLYEYSVKRGFDSACRGIEAELIKRKEIPDIPGSGYLLYLRRLQIIVNNEKWEDKTQLEAIIRLSEDLLLFKPLQNCNILFENLVDLLITSKLMLVHEHQLENSIVEKHISKLQWKELKSFFQLEDDTYKEHCIRVINAAKGAVEEAKFEGRQKKKKRCLRKHLRGQATSYISDGVSDLLSKLLQLLPPTALEKIINDEDIQNDLESQNAQEYKILLNCIKDSLTDSAITKAVDALVVKYHNPESVTHADDSNNSGCDCTLKPNSQMEISSTTVNEDMDIIQVNGKLWTVKRCASVLVDITSTIESVSEDSTEEEDVELQSTFRHENEIIIHNGKVWEVKPATSLPVDSQTALSDDSQNEIHSEDRRSSQAQYEGSEIRELDELITTMERYVAKLKYKLKTMKDRRAAQRYRPQTPTDGDQGQLDPKPKDRSGSDRQNLPHTSSNQPYNDSQSSNYSVHGRQHTKGNSDENIARVQNEQALDRVKQVLAEQQTNSPKPKTETLRRVSQSNCSALVSYVQSSSQEDNTIDSESLQLSNSTITTKKVIPETPELSERQHCETHTDISTEMIKTNKENVEPKKPYSSTMQIDVMQDTSQEMDESTESDTTYHTIGEESASEDRKNRKNCILFPLLISERHVGEDPLNENILQSKVGYKRSMINNVKEEATTDTDDLATRVKTSPRKCASTSSVNDGATTKSSPNQQQSRKSKKRKLNESNEICKFNEEESLEDDDAYHTPMNSPEMLTKRIRVDEVEVSLSSDVQSSECANNAQVIQYQKENIASLKDCRVLLTFRYLDDMKHSIYY